MKPITITPLDLAWEAVNALGGGTFCEEDRIINEIVGKAVAEIEKLGGEDPAPKRYTQRMTVNVVSIGDHDPEYRFTLDRVAGAMAERAS